MAAKELTDKELLEAAALAIGRSIRSWNHQHGVPVAVLDDGSFWQPLHENQISDCMGDALRLAVKLGIEIYDTYEYDKACAWLREQMLEFWEDIGDDRYAATRRAIVRAAAEIEKHMRTRP